MENINNTSPHKQEQLDDEKKEKLLDEKLLSLISKEDLSFEEKIKIFKLVVEHCRNVEMIKNNEMFSVEIAETTDIKRPIAQTGFSVDEKANFQHLITLNTSKIRTFPIERIILIACHECGHLSASNKIARTLDFSKEESIKKYIDTIKRKEGDWYKQNTESQADEYGFFTAKNIYQRAVHDTSDYKLKSKFWESFVILDENEKIEMSKHQLE